MLYIPLKIFLKVFSLILVKLITIGKLKMREEKKTYTIPEKFPVQLWEGSDGWKKQQTHGVGWQNGKFLAISAPYC